MNEDESDRKCDDNMIERMYDIIELIYILNRLTNKFCSEHSNTYLTYFTI